jgi:hypothetical protein
MIHEPRQTKAEEPGRLPVSRPAPCRYGFIRIFESLGASHSATSGYIPAIHGLQQRETGCLHVSDEGSRLDQQRYADTGTPRTGGVLPADRDSQGYEAEPRSVVRRDMGNARLASRNGHQTGHLRARSLRQKRSTSGHWKNACLTPPDGGYWQGIAPSHGVRGYPPTPPPGAMWTNLAHLSTPSHGDLYRYCHLSN